MLGPSDARGARTRDDVKSLTAALAGHGKGTACSVNGGVLELGLGLRALGSILDDTATRIDGKHINHPATSALSCPAVLCAKGAASDLCTAFRATADARAAAAAKAISYLGAIHHELETAYQEVRCSAAAAALDPLRRCLPHSRCACFDTRIALRCTDQSVKPLKLQFVARRALANASAREASRQAAKAASSASSASPPPYTQAVYVQTAAGPESENWRATGAAIRSACAALVAAFAPRVAAALHSFAVDEAASFAAASDALAFAARSISARLAPIVAAQRQQLEAAAASGVAVATPLAAQQAEPASAPPARVSGPGPAAGPARLFSKEEIAACDPGPEDGDQAAPSEPALEEGRMARKSSGTDSAGSGTP